MRKWRQCTDTEKAYDVETIDEGGCNRNRWADVKLQ